MPGPNGISPGLGFEERTRQVHHIFTRDGVEEILYQSRQGQTFPG
jgi:hypothetical protein